MTDPAITDLIAKLESASGPDRELDAEIAVAISKDAGAWVVNPSPASVFSRAPGWWRTSDDKSHEAPAYTTSVDAALALVERVLPDKFVKLEQSAGTSWYAFVMEEPEAELGQCGLASPPALAICIACLRALRAQTA